MNVLAYSTQDPLEVGAKVEEKLREELGAAAPIPFTVDGGAGTGVSAATLARGAMTALFGGREDTMYTLVFDIRGPRPGALHAQVNRQGIGCHVGALLFSAPLARPVDGAAVLDGAKPIFQGGAAAAKLNAAKPVLSRIDKLARTHANVGGLEVTIPRCVKVVPDGAGSQLLLSTVGRAHALGFKMALDAKEFFELAAAVEALL